jgi:hypothetical protein
MADVDHGVIKPTNGPGSNRGNHVIQGIGDGTNDHFLNAAAREAFTVLAADVGGVARQDDTNEWYIAIASGAGADKWQLIGPGNVVGPASSTDNAVARFDSTTGELLQDSVVIADDLGNVSGLESLAVDHTSAEADDFGVEVVVDAAGFADVKGVDIVYTTGPISAGEDEEAILINVDQSASTGGRLVGVEVVATGEGSAEIDALEVGATVHPVHQQSGTFADADSILVLAVDQTTALSSGGAGNVSTFVLDNDTVTIGDAAQYTELEFIVDTPASGSGIAPTFEYSTGVGTWAAFGPADGTNGMRNTGIVIWELADIPSWALGTGSEYLIRITRTRNSLGTTPILDLVQKASTVLYTWNADGDISNRSMVFADRSAPSNPGAALGALYKKSGDDGLFWKPDAAGAEVDLTADTQPPVADVTSGDTDIITVSPTTGNVVVTPINQTQDLTGFNIYYGEGAGNVAGNTTATRNNAFGRNSLFALTSGDSNNAQGHGALATVSTTDNNVGVGDNAGGNYAGANSVFIGFQAANSKASGDSCIAIGYDVEHSTNTVAEELVIGIRAAETIRVDMDAADPVMRLRGTGSAAIWAQESTGTDYTEIKHDGTVGTLTSSAGNLSITATAGSVVVENSTFASGTALAYPTADGSDGHVLTTDGAGTIAFEAVPSAPVTDVTTGDSNTITVSPTTGNVVVTAANQGIGHTPQSTAYGALSGNVASVSGTENTSFGYGSLGSVTTGQDHVAVGYRALEGMTTELTNPSVAVGSQAGEIFTGASGVFIGTLAGRLAQAGTGNTMLGHRSGYNVSTGATNTLLGNLSGGALTTGDGNICIGNNTAPSGAAVDDELNIGNSLFGDLSNDVLRVGGTGVISGNANLQVVGTGANDTVEVMNLDTSGGTNGSDIDVYVGTRDPDANSISANPGSVYHRRSATGSSIWVNTSAASPGTDWTDLSAGGAVDDVTSGDTDIITVSPTTGSVVVTPANQTITASTTHHTYYGSGAGNSGNDTTAFGFNSLTAGTGVQNTAYGSFSLTANVAGTRNTAGGYDSLNDIISNNDSTAFGWSALDKHTGGTSTALGSGAGGLHTTGTGSLFFGYNSGDNLIGGSDCISVGTTDFSTGAVNEELAIGVRAAATIRVDMDATAPVGQVRGTGSAAWRVAETTGNDYLEMKHDGTTATIDASGGTGPLTITGPTNVIGVQIENLRTGNPAGSVEVATLANPTANEAAQFEASVGSSHDMVVGISETAGVPTSHIKAGVLGGGAGPLDITGFDSITLDTVVVDTSNISFRTLQTDSSSAAAVTFDFSVDQKLKITLTENITSITLTPAAGPCNLVLEIVQDSTARTVTGWPAAVKWPGGTAPTISTGSGDVDILCFFYDGTNYYGSFLQDFS